VVESTKEKTVSLIHDQWFINKAKCIWPKRDVAVAHEEHRKPESNWTAYDV
jgi:hypothetical protein